MSAEAEIRIHVPEELAKRLPDDESVLVRILELGLGELENQRASHGRTSDVRDHRKLFEYPVCGRCGQTGRI